MQLAHVPDAALDAAYRRTRYEVDTPDGLLLLQIDVPNPGLRSVHDQRGFTSSALLTAWNPRSIPTAPAQNAAALERLRQKITALGLVSWPGRGCDPTGVWPAEESLFVPGLDLGHAQRLGRDFDQYALVHASADAVPRLIWMQT